MLPQRTLKKHQTHTPTAQQEQPPKPLGPGVIVAGRFKLIDKVGQGSFGSIYKTENIETGEICATKFEKRDNSKSGVSLLVREIKVLLELKDMDGFPQLFYYGRDDLHNYFMISYLGQNLEYLIRKTKTFSQISCLKLSLQLLDRLESFHNKNLIHRDLKPENIVIGWHDIDKIYLIDFGLAKYYRDSEGNHMPMVEKKGIIGTARYASISAHLGREQSRKDDLESLAYVLIYLNKGKLPWMNLVIQDKNIKYQKILEQKQQIPHEKLCENLPKCYYILLQHSKSRDFQEAPNYAFLKDQFHKALFELEAIESFQCYDWEKLPELKSKKSKKLRHSSSKLKQDPKAAILKKLDEKFEKHKRIEIIENQINFREEREKEKEKEKNEPIFQYPLIQEKKSQVSFLIVPELDNGMQSPDKQYDKKSRGYNSHNSYGTTKILNYQISQLQGEEGEQYKKYVQQFTIKRKDSKSFTMVTTNSGVKQQEAQKLHKRSTFHKEALAKHQEEVDQDYLSFDDLDLIANEEINLQFQNIGPFPFKKSINKLQI